MTYWLKKGLNYICFWGIQFSENILLLSISRSSLQTPSSDDIRAGNFAWSNWIILVEDLIRWKRGLKHFSKTTIQVILVSVSSTLHYTLQSIQGAISIIQWFVQYRYYLSACNRGLFKGYYCHLFQILWKNFLISSLYILEKKSPCQQI